MGVAKKLQKIIAILLMIFMTSSLPVPVAAQNDRQPVVGDYFEYEYEIWLDGGKGYYRGYTEYTFTRGKYSVTNVSGNNCTVKAEASWEYKSSEGERQSGNLDTTLTFALDTRLYLSGYELEYDVTDPVVWFYVGTGLQKDQRVKIIGDIFTVESTSATVWLGWTPKQGVELKTSGSYLRDDVYGEYPARYTDTYYFDKATGFILKERYDEYDDDGTGDGFHWGEELRVTKSSFSTPLDVLMMLFVYIGIPGIIFGTIAAILYRKYGPRTVKIATSSRIIPGITKKGRFVLRHVKRRKIPQLAQEAEKTALTQNFKDFIGNFIMSALTTKSKVAVARNDDTLRAVIIREKKTRTGLYFGPETLAVPMAKYLRILHFHSEHSSGGEVLERFRVLKLENFPAEGYSTDLVRPADHYDVPTMAKIWKKVYGEDDKYIKTRMKEGDICFVGISEGEIAGLGFCTASNGSGRLHGLTVMPEHRNRGIGRQITLARLHALRTLGISNAIMEVDVGNIPSLRIAFTLGFYDIGYTYLVTRLKRDFKSIPARRWM